MKKINGDYFGAVLLGKNYGVIEFYKKRAIRLWPAIIFCRKKHRCPLCGS
jgi:hypothetical protein